MLHNINNPLTEVVFRRWKDTGAVIALFPKEDEGQGRCSSFEHLGQHAAADFKAVIKATTKATARESADVRELCHELTSAPYFYHLKPMFAEDYK